LTHSFCFFHFGLIQWPLSHTHTTAVHYVVFILYALTIVHTMDQAHRSGEQTRAQTFKWFSSTILFYLCDRSTMYLNHKYQVGVVSSSAIMNNNNNNIHSDYPCLSSRMLLLKIRRPVLFHFHPGQYVQLQIPKIDSSWHSFYIASSPDDTFLEFYVQVFQENKSSWTSTLCRLLHGNAHHGSDEEEETNNIVGGGAQKDGELKVNRLDIEIMGPYGTRLAKTQDYSHVVAIGSEAGKLCLLQKPCTYATCSSTATTLLLYQVLFPF
jgi:FAD-binding domain